MVWTADFLCKKPFEGLDSSVQCITEEVFVYEVILEFVICCLFSRLWLLEEDQEQILNTNLYEKTGWNKLDGFTVTPNTD